MANMFTLQRMPNLQPKLLLHIFFPIQQQNLTNLTSNDSWQSLSQQDVVIFPLVVLGRINNISKESSQNLSSIVNWRR
jgi:hypothetical protein